MASMNWKRIVIGAASGGALVGGMAYATVAGVEALMSLSATQLFSLAMVGAGAGAVGVKVANRGE